MSAEGGNGERITMVGGKSKRRGNVTAIGEKKKREL